MKCGVFISNGNDFSAMNEVYAEFFGEREAGANHSSHWIRSPGMKWKSTASPTVQNPDRTGAPATVFFSRLAALDVDPRTHGIGSMESVIRFKK